MSSTQTVDDLTDTDSPDNPSLPEPAAPLEYGELPEAAPSFVPVEPVVVGPTRAERPATWLAATLLLALVFAVGVLVGQSGALGGLPAGNGSSGATNNPSASGTAGPTDVITGSTTDCATGAYSAGAPQEPAEAPADFDLFWQALACIRQNYVGRADLIDKDVTYGAINGMVEALGDTGHSVFLTPEALASEQQSLSGTVEGIGALLGTKDGQPIIVSVITGGPASAAGLKAGDIILTVNDEKVAGMNPGDVATKICGPAGTQVTLEIARPSTSEQLDVHHDAGQDRFPGRELGLRSRARTSPTCGSSSSRPAPPTSCQGAR